MKLTLDLLNGNWRRLPGLALLALTFLASPGCALLGLDPPSEEEQYENDPVAQAALSLRKPAGAASRRENAVEKARKQLVLGMSETRVRALWGHPQDVETAGDPSSGNQRWIYYNGLSRSYGTSSSRIVYFENGQVVGWENHR